eukprot:366093-Chlamydomonas_euryale.AAC.6
MIWKRLLECAVRRVRRQSLSIKIIMKLPVIIRPKLIVVGHTHRVLMETYQEVKRGTPEAETHPRDFTFYLTQSGTT